jgi:hypothetical protein
MCVCGSHPWVQVTQIGESVGDNVILSWYVSYVGRELGDEVEVVELTWWALVPFLLQGDCNNSCVITIVGYHGNPVYRVVASIPIWVTCGRFPWMAPTYGKRVKHKNVNSKYIHRKITRLWLTKDRPGISSNGAPYRYRTTNSRPKLLKRKHYLVKCPQSGLNTKTYWLTDCQP